MDSTNNPKVDTISENATVSPLIESTPVDTPVKIDEDTADYTRTPYTYILSIITIGLIVYLMFYSYTCFYENQDLIIEPFIEKTIKTGIDDDIVFDVDGEVNKLRQLQEKYLNSINSKRNS
jgi:hypothetical protein